MICTDHVRNDTDTDTKISIMSKLYMLININFFIT